MIPDISSLTLFFIAAAALLLTPGPAVLYIIARSIDQGRMAGIASTMGVGIGTLFHVAAAALGVSALLLSSALAFQVVKYLGAAYLIYLGIRKLMEKEVTTQPGAIQRREHSQIFYQGVLVNLLNPKTALFFFAFLPQFVNPERGSVTGQMLFLGITFVVMGLFSDGMYALLAGTVGGWLRGNLRFLKGQRLFAGSMYIFLGITAAMAGTENK